MTTENIVTSDNIRISIAIASFIFAIWQYLKRVKIEQLISAEATELHNTIAVALGATDAAIRAIQNG